MRFFYGISGYDIEDRRILQIFSVLLIQYQMFPDL